MYFLNVFNDGLRTIELSLCSLIYGLISFVFKVFDKLSTADILKDSTIEELISRLSLIIGLFMVFVVIFSFIKYIINPDQMIDKNKGAVSVVKKIIITIVLLGSTPFLFDTAFDIQEIMIRSNVIGKIILGKENTSSGNFGNDVSGTLFMTFYRINETPIKIDDTYTQCSILVDDLADEIALSNGDVSLAAYCLLEKNKYFVSNSAADAVNNAKDDDDKIDEYIIDFDGLLAVLAGGFFVYLGFLWTIQIGVRMFQLAYLQIISPIPILMYITPKGEEKLNKWGQQCITTFLDLFLRIAIIYFGMFLFDIINDFDFSMLFNENWKYNLYTRVILIIAVLTFIRKIPKLLQEIFPSMGGAAGFDYGLSFKKTIDNTLGGGSILRRGYGAAAVGANVVRKRLHQNIGAIFKDAMKLKNEKDPNKKKELRMNLAKNGLRVLGSGGAALGGIRRGLGTTNASGRKSAVSNALDAAKAKQKLHEAGYGSNFLDLVINTKEGREKALKAKKAPTLDILRGGVGLDKEISDIVMASDKFVEAQQQKYSDMLEAYMKKDPPFVATLSESHPGMYTVYNTATGERVESSSGGYFLDKAEAEGLFGGVEMVEVADTAASLKKEQSKNKALHQKEQEAKTKSGKE